MRFTERYDDILAITKDGKETHEKGVRIKDKDGGFEKFAKLEDIEEELGIDLVTLFKALRSGIHIIDDGYPYNDRVDLIYSSDTPCGFKGKVSDHCAFFKDYGKTWALTKEELL